MKLAYQGGKLKFKCPLFKTDEQKVLIERSLNAALETGRPDTRINLLWLPGEGYAGLGKGSSFRS